MTKQVTRATFAAVYNAQDALYSVIDKLIADNRPLTDEEERKQFLLLLAYGTLGLGKDHIINLYTSTGTYLRKDFETVARWAAYQNNPVEVPMDLFMKEGKKETLEIKEIWTVIRNGFHTIFPIALNVAFVSSKEKESGGLSKGYEV
jgi:hypothetical protein